MTQTINSETNSTGRLCVHVDGDNAVQEEQTVLCPEADSRNYMNSPGESSNPGLDGSILCETCGTNTQEANAHSCGEIERRHNLASASASNTERLKRRTEKVWEGIGRKQGIKVATLNVKGRGNASSKKWVVITTMIRKMRILVMAIQESHLNEATLEEIRTKCPKIEIISNSSYTTKEGVGFILNKDLIGGMK